MCGISACVNGTEDDSIHCLKSGRVASEALPTIINNTAILLSESQRQDSDRDPYANLNDDEEELETNQLLVDTDNF